jgi:hypothetical protein
MKIEVKHKEDLPNGDVMIEVTYDHEGLEWLVQEGLVSIIKQGIEKEKECRKISRFGGLYTPAKWLKSYALDFFIAFPRWNSDPYMKEQKDTVNTGESTKPTQPTSRTQPPSFDKVDTKIKSTLPRSQKRSTKNGCLATKVSKPKRKNSVSSETDTTPTKRLKKNV